MSSGQTNPHDAADPAAGDTGPPVVLPVVRDGRWWGTRGTGEGVVVFGRTLDQLRRSAKAALELRDGGPPPIVRLRPESPDLEALAAAREPYLAALRATISGLRTLGVSWVAAAHRLGQQRQCAGGGADPEQATGPVDDHRGEDVVGAQVEWRIGPEGPAVGGTAAGAEVLPHDRQAELGVGPGAAADAPCPADCRGAGGVLVGTRIEQTGDSLAFHQRGVQRVGLTPLEPTQPLARMSNCSWMATVAFQAAPTAPGPGSVYRTKWA